MPYFGHLMHRANSWRKTRMLGKIEGKRREQQRMRWLDSITNSMDMNLSKVRRYWRTEEPSVPQVLSMVPQSQTQTWLSEWTTINSYVHLPTSWFFHLVVCLRHFSELICKDFFLKCCVALHDMHLAVQIFYWCTFRLFGFLCYLQCCMKYMWSSFFRFMCIFSGRDSGEPVRMWLSGKEPAC